MSTCAGVYVQVRCMWSCLMTKVFIKSLGFTSVHQMKRKQLQQTQLTVGFFEHEEEVKSAGDPFRHKRWRREWKKPAHTARRKKKRVICLWPQWIKTSIKHMRQNSSFGIPSVRWLLLLLMLLLLLCGYFAYVICDFFSTCQIIRQEKTTWIARYIWLFHARATT